MTLVTHLSLLWFPFPHQIYCLAILPVSVAAFFECLSGCFVFPLTASTLIGSELLFSL